MRYRWLLVLLLVSLFAPPSQAGILFGRKKDRPDPKLRVPELVSILKADKDADKRGKAAEELREYDPAVFPEIVPALLEALASDAAPAVRIEAAFSLSRLRPVTQNVGEALEQAVAKDSSMRVRLQARSALLQYHWAGYRGKKTDVPPLNKTREPPMADAEKVPAIKTTPDTTKPKPDDKPGPRPTPLPYPDVTPVDPKGKPLDELPPAPNVKPKKDKAQKDKAQEEPPLAPANAPRPEDKTPPKPARPEKGNEGPELE
jgi:hypothetical protein